MLAVYYQKKKDQIRVKILTEDLAHYSTQNAGSKIHPHFISTHSKNSLS